MTTEASPQALRESLHLAGYIADEIAPMAVKWRKVIAKDTKETAIVDGVVDHFPNEVV